MKEKSLMYRVISIFLGLFSVLLVVAIIGGFTAISSFEDAVTGQNIITVTGEAEVFAAPDIASISFSVNIQKDTVEAAQEESAEKINQSIAFLEKEGIEEADIKTTSYNLSPRYEYRRQGQMCAGIPCPPGGKQVLVGYQVNQSIQVKVRDTEQVGKILAGIGELGVTNIYGPNFEIDEPDQLEEQATNEAIADARAKAKARAKALGVRLGDVVSVNEGGYGYPVYARGGSLEFAEDSAVKTAIAPEIPVGENIIRKTVTITYEIK